MKKKKNMFTVSSRLSALVLGLSISVVFLSSCNKSQSSISEKNEKEAASTDLSGNQDDEKDSNDSFTFPDITSMDAIVGATAIHLMDKNITYWEPSCKNAEDFWDVMCFYMGAEEGITNMNPEPPRAGKDGEYYVFPNSVWVNAGYACFPDFDGSLPEIGGKIWRALKVDQDHTGVAIGDTSRFEMISYTENEDHTVDAVYRYDGWEESRDYKTHMSINENYDKANDNFTYYYTIERVEEINSENTDSNESENDSWKQSYIDYIGADPNVAFDPDNCTCGLIYLDNDEIPELIIEYSNEADGTCLVAYKNGSTVSYRLTRTGGIAYTEREGLVHNRVGIMGSDINEFVFLDDEGFHDYGSGYRTGESQDFTNFTEFVWNDEKISEEEFMANISKYDDKQFKNWNSHSEEYQSNNYKPFEMCEYLSKNENPESYNAAVDDNGAWKQSYIDFIEMDQDITREADRCTFGLIYLNNDDIPDLICDFKDTTSATFIISFRDDQLDSIIFYRSGGIQYYEREGLIYNSCNSEEGIFDELAYLGDEGFQDLGKGFRYNDSHKSPEHAQFYWNDEEVSEEEYNNMINKIDPQKSKKWNTYSEEFKNNNYSRDEILQYLREN